MTLCHCILNLASQIPIVVTALAVWAFTVSATQVNKNKLMGTISYSHKVLIIFKIGAYVPGFNFFEFLVNSLSVTSYKKSTKLICKSHPASAENALYLLLINI